MQYCSLQHQTLLPSPVTSTTGCWFCFGSVSSFFLKLFLYCSLVAYWAPTDVGLLPWQLRRQSVCLQFGRPRFDPWVRKIPWRRKWQSTAVFLPGKSHGFRSLVGYSPWGRRVGHDWVTSLSLSPTQRVHLSCPIFLPFLTVHGVLKARILKRFAIPFSSGPRFARTLHYDSSVLGGPTQHGSQFH